MKKLMFLIKPDGSVEMLGSEGYGKSCLDATKGLEARLGEATPGWLTDDYHTETGSSEQTQQ